MNPAGDDSGIRPGPSWAFEFLPNRGGLAYQFVHEGERKEYHRSPHLVRDRNGLRENLVWQRHSHLFDQRFAVGYDDRWFFCTGDVWSPSVDAVFLLDELAKWIDLTRVGSILDLGCGTGVVGISVAKRYPRIRRLTLADPNPSAVVTSAINARANDVGCALAIESEPANSDSYDLGFVTPYYFPVETDATDEPMHRIQEAGRHVAELVEEALRTCHQVAFIYSSTTAPFFREVANFDYSDLDSIEVPFSLGDHVSNMRLLAAAREMDLLLERPDREIPNWHRLILAKAGG